MITASVWVISACLFDFLPIITLNFQLLLFISHYKFYCFVSTCNWLGIESSVWSALHFHSNLSKYNHRYWTLLSWFHFFSKQNIITRTQSGFFTNLVCRKTNRPDANFLREWISHHLISSFQEERKYVLTQGDLFWTENVCGTSLTIRHWKLKVLRDIANNGINASLYCFPKYWHWIFLVY